MKRLEKLWRRLHEDSGMERAWRAAIAERDVAIGEAIKEIEIVRGLNREHGAALSRTQQRIHALEGLLAAAAPATIGALRHDIDRALEGRATGVEV